jgi:hypothetical protein
MEGKLAVSGRMAEALVGVAAAIVVGLCLVRRDGVASSGSASPMHIVVSCGQLGVTELLVRADVNLMLVWSMYQLDMNSVRRVVQRTSKTNRQNDGFNSLFRISKKNLGFRVVVTFVQETA